MASIAVAPIILSDIELGIGSDNYEAHVSRAVLTPTTPTAVWKGMTPTAHHNLVGTPTWALELDFAQDHETASSMSLYLAANVGQVKAVTLEPKKGGSSFAVNVVIVPGAIGGALDSVATATVSLPVNGQPVRTAASS